MVGAILRAARRNRGLSAQGAAHRAGLSPITWRKVEAGGLVRAATLSALDGFHGLPDGTLHAATWSASGLDALASALGVDMSGDEPVVVGSAVTRTSPAPMETPSAVRFDAFDIGTLRRVVAVLEDEISRIEQAATS
jgi:transcriptional regulator with XRE-family HTH domain